MAKKKYLRKNEFRFYTNPKTLSKNKKPHPVYISAKHKRKYKANVITHSPTFFDRNTEELNENPNRNKDKPNDNRKSRISISFWDLSDRFP